MFKATILTMHGVASTICRSTIINNSKKKGGVKKGKNRTKKITGW